MSSLPPPGETPGRDQLNQQPDGGMRSNPLPRAGFRRVEAEMLDWGPSHSTAVISSAQKFILPVPNFKGDGEPLVYPESHEKAGQPITDYKGNPIGGSGIVFYNAKDKAVQAAPGSGEAVIILNQVTSAQADQLFGKMASFRKRPEALSLMELKEVLRFAKESLGLVDQYNSDRNFIRQRMTPVGPPPTDSAGLEIECFGLKKRDDRDICRAIYVSGKVLYEGPTVTPQVGEDGLVIVKIGDRIAAVQPEIFRETYRHADGREIQSVGEEIQNQEPGPKH